VTSFKDAVNILKGKRLVSENVTKEVSGAFFDAPTFKNELQTTEESLQEIKGVDEELLDIVLKYVKDPDEAIQYIKRGMPDWLEANLDRDEDYKNYLKSTRGVDLYPGNMGDEMSAPREGKINEAHKLDTEQILDRMSPYAVRKGIELELKKEKVIDNTTLNKIKTRVAKKLQKNKNAYEDQVFSNVKEIDKKDKQLETKEVTQELNDKHNSMKKIKGYKEEKANTKASKKENRKGKPKGVKVMPDKGVTGSEKILKEDIQDRADAINRFARLVKSKNIEDIKNELEAIVQFPEQSSITPSEATKIIKKYCTPEEAQQILDDINQPMTDPAGGSGLSSHLEEDEFRAPTNKPLVNKEEVDDQELEALKMKVIGWYKKNYTNSKSPLVSKWATEFEADVNRATNKQEIKQVVDSILMGDTTTAMTNLGLNEDKAEVLNNIKEFLQEYSYLEYHQGMEVNTPDGPGVVKEIMGGTLTIELEDSALRDYQMNVINKATTDSKEQPKQTPQAAAVDKDKEDRDAAFSKFPFGNLGSVKGPDTGIKKEAYKNMTHEEKLKAIMEKVQAMEEGEKKHKALDIVKKKLKEATKIHAGGEVFFKKDSEVPGFEADLKSAGVKYTKERVAS